MHPEFPFTLYTTARSWHRSWDCSLYDISHGSSTRSLPQCYLLESTAPHLPPVAVVPVSVPSVGWTAGEIGWNSTGSSRTIRAPDPPPHPPRQLGPRAARAAPIDRVRLLGGVPGHTQCDPQLATTRHGITTLAALVRPQGRAMVPGKRFPDREPEVEDIPISMPTVAPRWLAELDVQRRIHLRAVLRRGRE